jgi:hypothetical protein
MPLCFGSWLCSRLQVKMPFLLGPIKGARDQGLGIALLSDATEQASSDSSCPDCTVHIPCSRSTYSPRRFKFHSVPLPSPLTRAFLSLSRDRKVSTSEAFPDSLHGKAKLIYLSQSTPWWHLSSALGRGESPASRYGRITILERLYKYQSCSGHCIGECLCRESNLAIQYVVRYYVKFSGAVDLIK